MTMFWYGVYFVALGLSGISYLGYKDRKERESRVDAAIAEHIRKHPEDANEWKLLPVDK